MFLNYIRKFFVKRYLKNNLKSSKSIVFTKDLKSVGLLIDESKFDESENLVSEIIAQGIDEQCIKVVAFRNTLDKKESYSFSVFEKNSINWNGKIKDAALLEFSSKEFDLLISYYDTNNEILEMVTSLSKAKFKVGFEASERKLNQLVIKTNLQNYKLFIFELFKYLKSIK